MDLRKFDLNIQNYNISQIYQLFDFNDSEDLTNEKMLFAKKFVSKFHPDKSKLDSRVFQFYHSAYQVLERVYEVQKTTKEKSDRIKEYTTKKPINHLKNKESSNNTTNKFDLGKFNENFDIHKEHNQTDDEGYGEWMNQHQEKDDIPKNIQQKDMNAIFESLRKKASSMVVYNGIMVPHHDGGVLIDGSESNFSSGVFHNNNLEFQDLKQAYTETVIPVSEEQFRQIHKYNSVEDYKNDRSNFRRKYTYNTTQTSNRHDENHKFMQQHMDNNYNSENFNDVFGTHRQKSKSHK